MSGAAIRRAERLARDYPRVPVRLQLEAEHEARVAAAERHRHVRDRVAAYSSALHSPVSGTPLQDLPRVDVRDFDKHFGRAVLRQQLFGSITS